MKDRLGNIVSKPSNHHTIRLCDGGHDILANMMTIEQDIHEARSIALSICDESVIAEQ